MFFLFSEGVKIQIHNEKLMEVNGSKEQKGRVWASNWLQIFSLRDVDVLG